MTHMARAVLAKSPGFHLFLFWGGKRGEHHHDDVNHIDRFI